MTSSLFILRGKIFLCSRILSPFSNPMVGNKEFLHPRRDLNKKYSISNHPTHSKEKLEPSSRIFVMNLNIVEIDDRQRSYYFVVLISRTILWGFMIFHNYPLKTPINAKHLFSGEAVSNKNIWPQDMVQSLVLSAVRYRMMSGLLVPPETRYSSQQSQVMPSCWFRQQPHRQ